MTNKAKMPAKTSALRQSEELPDEALERVAGGNGIHDPRMKALRDDSEDAKG